ncbi:nitroreductase/quinone reductase family protein [Microbacter sp. GSS18]|nr:nitroreductase/quinone reductase family protein [Microbacter sp. GSS18]
MAEGGSAGTFSRLYWMKRLIYRGDRPGPVARALNGFWARQYRKGGALARDRDVTLEVRGRSSGRPLQFPVVLADHEGHWYLVSMLGEQANWVRNVRAGDGRAIIRHDGEHDVTLAEVAVAERAPILRRYLDVAPGARPHLAAERGAPPAAFERIAAEHPVFRIDGLPQPA